MTCSKVSQRPGDLQQAPGTWWCVAWPRITSKRQAPCVAWRGPGVLLQAPRTLWCSVQPTDHLQTPSTLWCLVRPTDSYQAQSTMVCSVRARILSKFGTCRQRAKRQTRHLARVVVEPSARQTLNLTSEFSLPRPAKSKKNEPDSCYRHHAR